MSVGFLTYLTVFLVVSGLIVASATPATWPRIVFHALATLISAIFLAAYWLSDYFTANGINDATIYHLKYGLSGAGFMEYRGLMAISLLGLLVCGIALIVFLKRMPVDAARKKSSKGLLVDNVSMIFLSGSLITNPGAADVYKLLSESNSQNGEFDRYYIRPFISGNHQANKNLVYIYAESLERTYFDEKLFPGLIKGLRELEGASTTFTEIRQLPGTGWTVAGVVASQCGIPLFTPSHGNTMSGMDEFLPSAVCLGDLLHKKGYLLSFFGGANLNFAGKGKFYSTHQFDEVQGRNELLPKIQDQTNQSWWGLYDDTVFEFSYKRFVELSEKKENFGLFTLTIDTHHPDGHPSRSCKNIKYRDGSNSMLNSVACSDRLITDYVNKILHSAYRDNTIIVVASDHLAMRNTAIDMLRQGQRRNLFMVIDPGRLHPEAVNTVGSTLDIGTTLLPYLGFDGKIGLGRNLLKVSPEEASEIKHIHESLLSWQQSIIKFWAFPVLTGSIEIDLAERQLNIGGRLFSFPCLIELDENFETTMRFQMDASVEEFNLSEEAGKIKADHHFILIDYCRNSGKSEFGNGFCRSLGTGGKILETVPLKGNARISVDALRDRFGLI